jgi:hypothetical protein
MSPPPYFDVFLSHRGVDSKHELAGMLLNSKVAGNIYLDCLTPSRGSVNRLFVFESLVRSRAVFVVATSRYDESPWCRKERALAKFLSTIGRVQYREFEVASRAGSVALREVQVARKESSTGGAEKRGRPAIAVANSDDLPRIELQKDGKENWKVLWAIPPKSESGISHGPLWYIYTDLNNRHRRPNRDSLRQAKDFVRTLDDGIKLLDLEQAGADPASFAVTVRHILETLLNAAARSNQDICAAAETDWRKGANTETAVLTVLAQVGFGLLSIGSTTANKVEARGSADTVARLTLELIDMLAQTETAIRRHWKDWFAAMMVSVALECDREHTSTLAVDVGTSLCGAAGIIKARQLLLDVRETDESSRFRLRFAGILVRYGIGSAVLVQSSDNLVHNTSVDGLQLNVLPCITLYPGMADLTGLTVKP